jgi:nucleoid-associated protein YgaU
LESIELKDENDRLRREVSDLKARLGSPLLPTVGLPEEEPPPTKSTQPVHEVRPASPKPAIPATYVVRAGDSLYAISKKVYGNASYINSIYLANRDTMKSKNSLKVGQTLRLPPSR